MNKTKPILSVCLSCKDGLEDEKKLEVENVFQTIF